MSSDNSENSEISEETCDCGSDNWRQCLGCDRLLCDECAGVEDFGVIDEDIDCKQCQKANPRNYGSDNESTEEKLTDNNSNENLSKKRKHDEKEEDPKEKSKEKKRKTQKEDSSSFPVIVFCDTKNKEIDIEYSEKIIEEFRKQTGWKVEKNTRIWNDLRDFSKGYSKEKRNVTEVVAIFRIANGLISIQ